MKAIKYCNCQQDETSDENLLKGWLVGSVQRGRMRLPVFIFMIIVTVHQGIYKCCKCDGVDHIVVLQVEIDNE